MASPWPTSKHSCAFQSSLDGNEIDQTRLGDRPSSYSLMNGVTTSINPGLPSRRAHESGGSPSVGQSLLWKLFHPIRFNLENLRGVSTKEITDMLAAAKTMREELIEIGSRLVAFSSEFECTEDDDASFW